MEAKLVTVNEYEKKAYERLPQNARDYYKSGAGDEYTLQLNKDAFRRIRIRPRFLVPVSNRDMSIEIFGDKVKIPFGVSPTAMQKMAHADGESANARAAGEVGTIFTLSTLSTTSLEEVAKAAPNTIKWFQLYVYYDRQLTISLIKRAEAHGYKALVLTVDAPVFGLRRADMRNKFKLPTHLKLANFEGNKSTDITKAREASGLTEYVTKQFDGTLTWEDVKWLLSVTKLPVLVKGLLTAEDALKAVEIGVHGVIVSNHGARQLDGVPASIEALPEIARAVGHKTTVIMDGGVRQGEDIFKALALGAKMVFFGRPALWGLTLEGQKGVENVLNILKNELDVTMAIAGCRTVGDIGKSCVVHESYYSRL